MYRCKLVALLTLLIFLPQAIAADFTMAASSAGAGQSISSAGNDYLAYFYNRYSLQLDQNGFKYAAPDYGVPQMSEPKSAREIISLASYYKYKALQGDKNAKSVLRGRLLQAYQELSTRPDQALSFNDSEAFFLMIRLTEQLPDLWSSDEKKQLSALLAKKISPGLSAGDTENRAIIAGAHWQYLNNYLFNHQLISLQEKSANDTNIKNKIAAAVKSSVSAAGWYREEGNVVPHYHAAAAYMLWVYGRLSGTLDFDPTVEKMYLNIKKITLKNGLVEAQIGHRPAGLGAQFYLMAGTLGRALGDTDYAVYLNYASHDRFFSDPKYPNRLEYHRTSTIMKARTVVKWSRKKKIITTVYDKVKATPNYHDDYAFADAAELGLIIHDALPAAIPDKRLLEFPMNFTDDGELQIANSGARLSIFDIGKKQLKTLDLVSGATQIKTQEKSPALKDFSKIKLAADARSSFIGQKITTPVESYIVADETGNIRAGKNIDEQMLPASITKMMTALVFIEHRAKNWQDDLIFSKARHFVYGNYLNFKDGDRMTVRDVFSTMMINSINEAAEMIVEATDLTRGEFIAEMNNKAFALGMAGTHYTDVSGFSLDNITTAADQLKLLQEVYKNPEIREVMSTPVYAFEAISARGKPKPHHFKHTNTLLRETVPFEITASKTGFLDEAQKCLAMVIRKNGKLFFLVTMGDPSFSGDNVNVKLLLNTFIR